MKSEIRTVLNQRVLLLEEVSDPAQTGKLVRVEGDKNPLGRGKVCFVADDLKNKIVVGDTVIFDRRQALPLKVENEEYLLVHESMLYLVFTGQQT